MRRQKQKEKKLIIGNDAIQAEEVKGNMEVSLIVMTLLMRVETQLIKLLLRLHLVFFKATTNYINKIAEQIINQIISKGGAEVEWVLPKILRGAIKDVYETPFRFLGSFGKQQLNKIKREVLR